MKNIIYIFLTIALISCSNETEQLSNSEKTITATSVSQSLSTKIPMRYFEELLKFDKSKFQHNGLKEFKSILQAPKSYPSFQDSSMNRYGIKQYYCDLTYNNNFDLFTIIEHEGGDCDPMISLYSTNKIDSMISKVQLTQNCDYEGGYGSLYGLFDSDSTFTVHSKYENRLSDSTGAWIDSWEGAEKEILYAIDNKTGLITIVDQKESKTKR